MNTARHLLCHAYELHLLSIGPNDLVFGNDEGALLQVLTSCLALAVGQQSLDG